MPVVYDISGRYRVDRTDGGLPDPNAAYLVLRLDTDEYARIAVRAYVEAAMRTAETEDFELARRLAYTLDRLERGQPAVEGNPVPLPQPTGEALHQSAQIHFDFTLDDGRVAHCFQVNSVGYSDAVLSAGLVSGLESATLYVRIERTNETPEMFFLRPDEMLALLQLGSGAMWHQVFLG